MVQWLACGRCRTRAFLHKAALSSARRGTAKSSLSPQQHQRRRKQAPRRRRRRLGDVERPIPVQHAGHGAGLTPGFAIALEYLRRKEAAPRRASERPREARVVAGLQQHFRKPRQPQDLHIPAPVPLVRIGAHRVQPDRRMGRLQHRGAEEPPRRKTRHSPRHRRAPVVPDDVESLPPQDVGQAEDVARKNLEPVRVRPFGLAAQVVAALVRRDHAETLRRERREILAPAEPELGETVQEHDERTVVRTRFGAVKRHAVGCNEAESNGGVRRQRVQSRIDPAFSRRALSVASSTTFGGFHQPKPVQFRSRGRSALHRTNRRCRPHRD